MSPSEGRIRTRAWAAVEERYTATPGNKQLNKHQTLSSLAPDLGDYLKDQHRTFCSATLHRNIYQPTHIIKLAQEDFPRNSSVSRTKLSSNPATNLAWTPRKVNQVSNTIKSPASIPGTRSHPDIRAKMRQWFLLLHTKSLPIVSLEHLVLNLSTQASPHQLRRCPTHSRSSALPQSLFLLPVETTLLYFYSVDSV
jgi:hypothetical protein